MKKHWKKLLIAGVLSAGLGGGLVWWNVLRVDPEYAAQQDAIEKTIDTLDSDLGVNTEDDFDLDRELEGLGVPEHVSEDDINLD